MDYGLFFPAQFRSGRIASLQVNYLEEMLLETGKLFLKLPLHLPRRNIISKAWAVRKDKDFSSPCDLGISPDTPAVSTEASIIRLRRNWERLFRLERVKKPRCMRLRSQRRRKSRITFVNIAQFFYSFRSGFHTALTLCPRFAAWVFRSYIATLRMHVFDVLIKQRSLPAYKRLWFLKRQTYDVPNAEEKQYFL